MKTKAIYKALLAAVVAAPALSGCIEEAFPTSGIVQGQLDGSPKATEAIVWAMPGHLNSLYTISDSHWDIGYPGLMIIRDVFTEDFLFSQQGSNYNHFTAWANPEPYLGQDYMIAQYPWNWCYAQINICNKVIKAIDPATENTESRLQLAVGHAYRAFTYLDFGRMYEALPTDGYTLDDKVLGMTLMIVDEKMTEDDMRNNPRVSHETLVKFINDDLDKAIALYDGAASLSSKTLPSLAVVYGLKARTLLWDASFTEEVKQQDATALYTEAKKYADLALSTHGENYTTREEWLNTTTGFNDASVASWMFAGQYVSEDDAVTTGGLLSWIGWLSPEQRFGYASPSAKCYPEIGAALYNRIDNRDFRKLSFVAPEGSTLDGQMPYLDPAFAAENFTEPYIGIKFRPASGNMNDGKIAAVTSYPLMRTEEMKFISIECSAHLDPAKGKEELEDFMKNYRCTGYKTNAATKDAIIEEIIFQKRVELWGEGQVYFDLKRLGYPVTRAYNGTNFMFGQQTYNTAGRPAWYNFVITRQEWMNNTAFSSDLNTPDPSGKYTIINKL